MYFVKIIVGIIPVINSHKKLLKVINKNKFLKSFKISLFSSNISYLILSLIKIYERIKSEKILEEYAENEGNN